MTKKTGIEIRLGPGEYHNPKQSNNVQARYARLIFIDVLARLAPEVFGTLNQRRDLLDAYVAAAESAKPREQWSRSLAGVETPKFLSWSDLTGVLAKRTQGEASRRRAVRAVQVQNNSKGAPVAKAAIYVTQHQRAVMHLRVLLSQWAHSFQLKEAWLLEFAMEDLHLAAGYGKGSMPIGRYRDDWMQLVLDDNKSVVMKGFKEDIRDGFRVAGHRLQHLSACVTADETIFKFEHPGWDPVMTTWKATRSDIEASISKALDDYAVDLRELVEQRGFVKSDVKKHLDRDLGWLVRYQVLGQAPAHITQVYLDEDPDGDRVLSASAITKAIEKAATLVGITLRN
jgi:hypothetical protein